MHEFVVSPDTWKELTAERREWILYDTMQRLLCEVKCLRKWNRTASFVGGVIGGFIAALGVRWVG
jgi:fructose-specific phosphotransferase system IIC component